MPNSEEMVKCMDDLEEVEVHVCGVCFCVNDQHLGCDIDWTQCQLCNMWFHQSCIDCHDVDLESFTCHYCITD